MLSWAGYKYPELLIYLLTYLQDNSTIHFAPLPILHHNKSGPGSGASELQGGPKHVNSIISIS